MELMTKEEREKANKEALDKLRKIHEFVNKTELDELKSKAGRTFTELKYMIFITFALGIALIIFCLGFSLYNTNNVTLPFGLGTLGLGDLITILAYRPMDRLQKANADFNEQIMITSSWMIAVNAYLLAMDVDKPDSLTEAAKNIQTASWRSLRDIQSIIKESSSTTQSTTAQQSTTTSSKPQSSQK